MKVLNTLFLFLCITIGQAQEYSVELFPNRYRLSWENVSMSEEPDLGFIGIGFDLFNITSKSSTMYLGINSYSALKGIRPGLITFGMSTGWRKKLFDENLYVDFGAFVGGGGGGGADDGGGLIIRPHIALEKRIRNLGFRVGFSRIDFPTGSITGNQINFGITLNGANYFKVEDFNVSKIKNELLNTNKLRVAMVGTQYYNFEKGSAPARPVVENGKVSLIGVQIERIINQNLYGILKMNGAFHGGADGYMSILFGAGGTLPVIKNRLNLEGRLLFGPSGGGAIEAGGGATAQTEIGLSLKLKKGYSIKLMTGKTFAPWGPFNANHIEFGIGKSLEVLSPSSTQKRKKHFNIDTKEYNVNHLAISTFNRTYFPPSKPRKGGDIYQSSFNLLGFEVQKYIGKRFSLNGGTVWAYDGDYGAYAEGLFGATYYHPIHEKWNLTAKGMFGAAGGGGIDLGSGLLFQYAVGIERKINQKWNLYLNVGKVQPFKGNFTPYSLDIGIKFHLNQLLKI